MEEGVWRDYYSGEKLENYTKPWNERYPLKRGVGYDCVTMSNYDTFPINESWREDPCTSYTRTCPCSNNKLPPLLSLRGLCPSSLLKTTKPDLGLQFTPVQRPQDLSNMWFQGGMTSKIYFNNTKWTIDDDVQNVTAVSNAEYNSYVLGKHEWMVTGDDVSCHKGEAYTTFFKLTGCLDGDFTCDDGQCVRMEQRCDQLPDCDDESDEMGCKLVVLKDSYNKGVPPISAKSALDRTIVPASVGVSIVLMEVVSIDEVDHSIQLQFEVILSWIENRATYLNLKKETALNKLKEKEVQQLWLPLIIYTNTDQKKTTRLGEYGNGEWSTAITRDSYLKKFEMSNLTCSTLCPACGQRRRTKI